MHPRLRFWIITALSLLAAVVIAFGVAQESFFFAEVLAAAIIWMVLEYVGGARPEAWAVAIALFGYIVANRGFAQVSLFQRFPLLPAETALMAGLIGTAFRVAKEKTIGGMRDPLNFAIAAWMLLGTARLWTDLRLNGPMALRDYATIYYALFYFVAQALASHAPSARLLRRTMIAACAILPLTYFLFTKFEDVLEPRVVFRGAPLIYYKEDLVAAYLFAGVYLLMTVRARWRWWALAWAVVAYASAFNINSSRAALVGLLTTGIWWAIARRWTPWRMQALVVPAGGLALALVAVLGRSDFNQSRLYALYEHVASVVDVSGSHHYESDDQRYVGDNNRFRLAWWHSVFDQTMAEGPVFGVGWGADITEPFVRSYQLDLGDDFNTRSPHSILFTVLGRMGLVGFVAFLGVIAAMALRTLQLVRIARTNDDALPTLGWWSVAWVMFVSGCFGVVLEGPMGAVVFWIALGLANAQTRAMAGAIAAKADTLKTETLKFNPVEARP